MITDEERATALANFVGNFFAGQSPGVIGSALADLMHTFLLNHKIPDNLAQQDKLREDILAAWCDTVRELVALAETHGATKQ